MTVLILFAPILDRNYKVAIEATELLSFGSVNHELYHELL